MFLRPLLLSLVPCAGLFAQQPVRIVLEPFATGFSSPVDIAHCGDDRLFIVEQAGRIKIVDPSGTVTTTPFLNIQSRVTSGGEQGLLGLAFDPDYATTGEFYVYYTAGGGNGISRISRFSVTADPNVADPDSEEILYTLVQPAANHNGGDIDFGPDGYLYVGFGDGGSGNDPWDSGQTLTDNALGDMIRIDVRSGPAYSIPADNPWVNAGNDTLPEIWASGLRNPFRWGFDALTGDLWIGDVGQGVQEEVDFWPAGDNSGPNFGWRCYEGNVATPGINDEDCAPFDAYVPPVSIHTHGAGWCSVIGGRVYRGQEFPRLFGRYIYTDYCPTPYFSLEPDGNGGFTRQQILTNNGGVGTSCIAENSALELFVANVNNGTIKRIVDECPMPAPTITQDGNELTSSEADTYTWFFNDEEIDGADTQTITIDQLGNYYVVAGFNGVCSFQSEVEQVIELGVGQVGGQAFQLFPVPAKEVVTLSGLPLDVSMVEVTDLTGRVVLTQTLNGSSVVNISIAELAPSNYVVALRNIHGQVVHQRIMQVQR